MSNEPDFLAIAAMVRRFIALLGLLSACSFEERVIRLDAALDHPPDDVTSLPDIIDISPPVDTTRDTAPSEDTSPSCLSPRTLCGSSCVDLTTNASNCGTCGRTCAAGQNCMAGSCACPSGQSLCGATCRDTGNDPLNCGACERGCVLADATTACQASVCRVVTCFSGYADCDGVANNGCEVHTTTGDTANCGRCGSRCSSAGGMANCAGGECAIVCNAGLGNCDGSAANGCETSTANSVAHCGMCRRACAAGQSCVDGTCTSPQQRSCTPAVAGCGLVAIVGGTFTQGEDLPDYGRSPAQRGITVGNFALDAYEVTVARFNAFWSVRTSVLPAIRSTNVAYPGGQSIAWGAAALDPITQSFYPNYNWSATSTNRDSHPMNGVDWRRAQEFCVWDGGRLPTEAEWEYAAHGRTVAGLSMPRAYPWGDTDPSASCGQVHWNRCAGTDGGATRPVGGSPAVGGLFDMAGSVYEWTADNFGTYPLVPNVDRRPAL